MLFNSLSFLLFFILTLVISYSLGWRARKAFLLVVSYCFYAAWNPPFVVLLWISTIADWYIAKGLGRVESRFWRRVLLTSSLLVNLGILGFFKYGGFVLENFIALSNVIGWKVSLAEPSIILPVGISFYTFQTISYTFDVYRKKAKPWNSFLDFALYVTFFPQLVAGPIVRAVDFLPQCVTPTKMTGTIFSWGIVLLIVGLFEKVVMADGIFGPVTEALYSKSGISPSMGAAWVGTLAFAGQIFCDFAGYSTCAIGVAMCLGFALPDNFRFPYAAIGFSDFWRRWHISLSAWLRDYVYIPLGGNRLGLTRTYANLMMTMLIGGLWHGASWNFVFWGGLHGVFLIAERLIVAIVPPYKIWNFAWMKFTLAMGTFALVCFTYVFFRAQTFETALVISSAMLGIEQSGEQFNFGALKSLKIILAMAGVLSLHWIMRDTSLEVAARKLPVTVQAAILAVMIALIISFSSGNSSAFIYFQF